MANPFTAVPAHMNDAIGERLLEQRWDSIRRNVLAFTDRKRFSKDLARSVYGTIWNKNTELTADQRQRILEVGKDIDNINIDLPERKEETLDLFVPDILEILGVNWQVPKVTETTRDEAPAHPIPPHLLNPHVAFRDADSDLAQQTFNKQSGPLKPPM